MNEHQSLKNTRSNEEMQLRFADQTPSLIKDLSPEAAKMVLDKVLRDLEKRTDTTSPQIQDRKQMALKLLAELTPSLSDLRISTTNPEYKITDLEQE